MSPNKNVKLFFQTIISTYISASRKHSSTAMVQWVWIRSQGNAKKLFGHFLHLLVHWPSETGFVVAHILWMWPRRSRYVFIYVARIFLLTLRKLGGQQINNQILLRFLNLICLAINRHLAKKRCIYFSFEIWIFGYLYILQSSSSY